MFKPNCTLRELQANRFEDNEGREREKIEMEAHRFPVHQDMEWPCSHHQQNVMQSNAEWRAILAKRSQQEQIELEARLQAPPEPTDIDIARGQLRTARSLLLGTPERGTRKKGYKGITGRAGYDNVAAVERP
jgi:hypothetical protein